MSIAECVDWGQKHIYGSAREVVCCGQGDTYDRVKEVEEVAFLESRASVIDDVESMMSKKMIEDIE